jgi:hypothetical protein
MLPDPRSITVEQAPHTVLFPRDDTDRIFHQGYDRHASALFGPMWEYKDRSKYSYVFMTRELLNLLYTLKAKGLIRGIQAEFGCSPWPATNIWFEDPGNNSLPDEARHGLSDTYWAQKYPSAFDAIRAGQSLLPEQNCGITRLLVDYHFMVHQLAEELPDHPVTAEMELRAFNNEEDVLYDTFDSLHNPSHIGLRMGTDPKTMARLRQLNELSFESAGRRAAERQGLACGSGQPFLSGAILSSIFNYIPWKAFLKKLNKYLLPGGLLVVYNAQEGERAHLDWKNIAEDQETIAAFIQQYLGYNLSIHELIKDGSPITPLYLVAEKITL